MYQVFYSDDIILFIFFTFCFPSNHHLLLSYSSSCIPPHHLYSYSCSCASPLFWLLFICLLSFFLFFSFIFFVVAAVFKHVSLPGFVFVVPTFIPPVIFLFGESKSPSGTCGLLYKINHRSQLLHLVGKSNRRSRLLCEVWGN